MSTPAVPRRRRAASRPTGRVAGDRPAGRPHARRGAAVLASRSAACRWPASASPRPAGRSLGIARVGGVILITWVVLPARLRPRRPLVDVRDASPRRGRRARTRRWSPPWRRSCVVAVAFVAPTWPRHRRARSSIAAVQGGGEQGTSALDVPSRRWSPNATSTRPRRSQPDADLDLVVWPENAIDVDDVRRQRASCRGESPPRPRRLGAPIAVGVTEDVAGRPGQFINAQVVVAPDGRDRRAATTRCAGCRSASTCRCAACSRRSARPSTRSAATPSPAPGRRSRRCPTARRRLAVVISWEVFFGGRARDGVKHGGEADPQPDQRVELHAARSCRPSRSPRAGCAPSRPAAGWCRRRPPGSARSSRPTATCSTAPASASRRSSATPSPLRAGRTWYVTLGDRPFVVAAARGVWRSPSSATTAVARRDASPSAFEQERDRAVVDE